MTDDMMRIGRQFNWLFTLLALQAVCLGLGLWIDFRLAASAVLAEARRTATANLKLLSEQLRHPLDEVLSDRTRSKEEVTASLERCLAATKLGDAVICTVVNRDWQVIDALSSPAAEADKPRIGETLTWIPDGEASAAGDEELGSFLTADGLHVAVARPANGAELRLLFHQSLARIRLPAATFPGLLWPIHATAFLWTCVLQGIALYMVGAKFFEKFSKRNAAGEVEAFRRLQAVIRARDGVMLGLASMVESRDDATRHHLDRVSAFSTRLAAALQNLATSQPSEGNLPNQR